MKFAIINDIHIGPEDRGYAKGVQRKLIAKAEKLIKEFVDTMNTTEHPEFVVNLGDVIEDVNNRDIDVHYFKKAIRLFDPLKMPIYFLIGNHDIRTLSVNEIATMLKYDQMHYSFDHSEYHFTVLSFEMTGDHTKVLSDITAAVPNEQIEWLKKDLSKTDKPTVIFIHYGLAEDDMKGNFWFEGEAQYALLENRKELRKIFEVSGKVKAVISAHQHWNRMFVHNGIPYFTVTSLIENFKNEGVAAEAYTIVNIDENKIVVDVRGNDPARYEYAFVIE